MTDDGRDGGTVTACPECDDTRLWRRTGNGTDPDTRWRCKICGHEFDEPVEREPHAKSTHSPDSLAGQLEAMDPDDLVTSRGDD